jgi:hypothetical protein
MFAHGLRGVGGEQQRHHHPLGFRIAREIVGHPVKDLVHALGQRPSFQIVGTQRKLDFLEQTDRRLGKQHFLAAEMPKQAALGHADLGRSDRASLRYSHARKSMTS